MEPVVIESNVQKRHDDKVRIFFWDLRAQPQKLQEAFQVLQKLRPQEIEQVYNLTQRFQALVQEKVGLFPEAIEPQTDKILEGGEQWGWIPLWLRLLQQGPVKTLRHLPYKQCYNCSQSLTRSRRKFYCSDHCSELFKRWRDNVIEVAAKKAAPAKQQYLHQKAMDRHHQQKMHPLVTVVEAALKIASQQMATNYAFIPPEFAMQYTAQRFKIAEWLLKRYCQRRVLPTQSLPDLTLTGEELVHYQSPHFLFNLQIKKVR